MQITNTRRALKFDRSLLRFWSDCTIVLCWIRGRTQSFKLFVANRIEEVHDSSRPSRWRYVSTRENPADLPTRGAAVPELKQSEMWWRGPTFQARSKEGVQKQRLILVLRQQ